jgi:ADP-heptose:LPS heptosyltransferase
MSILKRSNIAAAFARGGFHAMRFIERGMNRKPPDVDGLRHARRFLFLEYSPALGTNVHATPIFEALKRAVPDAVTMVACSQLAFEVFRHNPFIDYLVETPRPPVSALLAIRSLREHLKATGFVPDLVVTSKGNEQRSIALLAFLAGKATRLGYTLAPELYDVVLRADPEQSLIDNNMRVIEGLGYRKDAPEPRVAFGPEELRYAQSLLATADIDRPRVAFITQTSPTQRKSWPVDRFIAVANHVTRIHGGCGVFLGTGKEAGPIETLCAAVQGNTISLAGKTTISQVAAALSLCDYAISLDTGNMHIGRSVGLPMVILAPAWQPVIEWLPLGFDQYRILKGNDIPQATPDYVMNEMGVPEVIATLDDLFARYPVSAQSREDRIRCRLAHVAPESRRPLT